MNHTGLAELRDHPLGPRDHAILHWRALDAPSTHIARVLRVPQAEVDARLAFLATTPFESAAPPRSAVDRSQRTATTLIRNRLTQSAEQQLVFVAGEGTLTVGEVTHLVARLAAAMSALGVRKGERIAVDASQRIESYMVLLAGLLIGADVVRLGESVGPQTLRRMVAGATLRVTFSDRLELFSDLPQAGVRIALSNDRTERSLEALLADHTVPAGDFWSRLPVIQPHDIALTGFSSGSTGEPKEIQVRHESVFRAAEIAQNILRFDATDIFCSSTDFTAMSGFRSLATLPLLSGGRLMIPDRQACANPLALALLCRRYGVTRLTVVPSVVRALNKAGPQLGPDTFASLRSLISGTGLLDSATVQAFHRRYGAPVVDHYGGGEMSTVAYAGPSDSQTMCTGGAYIREILAAIVGEDDQPVRWGEPGEIVVHNECITPSDLPSIRTDGPWAGWHFTGDLGRYLPDGRLEIVGRKRDVVKTHDGGLLSPAEIEGVLNGLDWVGEAAAFSWTDQHQNERAAAAVTVLGGNAGISNSERANAAQAAVRAALGDYKMPAHVMILDELPRVARGKPNKPQLRAMLDERTPAKAGHGTS